MDVHLELSSTSGSVFACKSLYGTNVFRPGVVRNFPKLLRADLASATIDYATGPVSRISSYEDVSYLYRNVRNISLASFCTTVGNAGAHPWRIESSSEVDVAARELADLDQRLARHLAHFVIVPPPLFASWSRKAAEGLCEKSPVLLEMLTRGQNRAGFPLAETADGRLVVRDAPAGSLFGWHRSASTRSRARGTASSERTCW